MLVRQPPTHAPLALPSTLQTERAIRFVGLSTALANAQDLADWLGITGPVRHTPHPHIHLLWPSMHALLPACPAPYCLLGSRSSSVVTASACSPSARDPSLQGLFNFKPSVRPVPLECHIQVGGWLPGPARLRCAVLLCCLKMHGIVMLSHPPGSLPHLLPLSDPPLPACLPATCRDTLASSTAHAWPQ